VFVGGGADALVGGVGLAVDAVGVDLEQDGDVRLGEAASQVGTPGRWVSSTAARVDRKLVAAGAGD
jgi:hypothetical protein